MLALELMGIAAFSVSGALAAIEKHLDVFGVLVCSVTTALGGGIIRDVMCGNLPPVMFKEYSYLITAAIVSAVTFITARVLKKKFSDSMASIDRINNVVDAMGLGLFTVMGINTGITVGYADNAFFVVFLGLITGVGGGVLRDAMLSVVPLIFSKRVYAVASLVGGVAYYVMFVVLSLPQLLCVVIAVLLIFTLRILASVFRWDLPKAF